MSRVCFFLKIPLPPSKKEGEEKYRPMSLGERDGDYKKRKNLKENGKKSKIKSKIKKGIHKNAKEANI
jgi:hypothetical protein